MSEAYSFDTQLIHNKHRLDPATGAVSIPIQHATTFHQEEIDRFGPYDYSRTANPTRLALEETIAQLEGGRWGFAFSSGMAAISTALLTLSQGDHVLVSQDVYGGTFRLVKEVLVRYGIRHTFVDMTDLDQVEKAIRPETKVIYVETPSNPLLSITDIGAVARLARDRDILTFVDNTMMTPALQRPLELGADLVIHSATKFIGGHSDVLAGLVVTADEALAQRIGYLQNALGAVLGVQDCWLLLRGLKTLGIRMKQSTASATAIASYLEGVPEVVKVYYPGLKNHPGYDLHLKQASSPGAVLSFALKDYEAVKTFVSQVKIPVFAVSLGAVESILSYPAKMSHAAMPKEEREKRGITDGLLRLSVGLENVEDLIADFEAAFLELRKRS